MKLKTLYYMKETRYNRLLIIWFHLNGMSHSQIHRDKCRLVVTKGMGSDYLGDDKNVSEVDTCDGCTPNCDYI